MLYNILFSLPTFKKFETQFVPNVWQYIGTFEILIRNCDAEIKFRIFIDFYSFQS